MKKKELKQVIKEETKKFFNKYPYSLEDELILENEIMLGELLDPSDYYEYEGSKGFYFYVDSQGHKFFVRLVYQPTTNPHFEFKTGWIDEKGKPKYEPSIPPNSAKSSSMYLHKRSNTVAKIFKDEILPFFDNQNISNIMVFKPISPSRARFAKIMIKKLTPKDKYKIDFKNLIIEKI